MKTTWVLFLASMLTFALVAPCIAEGEMTPPPAIYLPYGGKIVTEINLSDDDVLGIIKQSIPALADVARELLPLKFGEKAEAVAGAIDVTDLMQAIGGVTNVRIVIAKYPSKISPERFLKEFDAGVTKAGRFNKVLTDFGFCGGAAGLYALPGNAGCMGFTYDPAERTVYAARVVGGLDVPRLIRWIGNIAKVGLSAERGQAQEEKGENTREDSGSAPPAEENP